MGTEPPAATVNVPGIGNDACDACTKKGAPAVARIPPFASTKGNGAPLAVLIVDITIPAPAKLLESFEEALKSRIWFAAAGLMLIGEPARDKDNPCSCATVGDDKSITGVETTGSAAFTFSTRKLKKLVLETFRTQTIGWSLDSVNTSLIVQGEPALFKPVG
jgi:hypothetical protein